MNTNTIKPNINTRTFYVWKTPLASMFSMLWRVLSILIIFSNVTQAESDFNEPQLTNIREYLKENQKYNGVVLIAKNNKILVEHASGYADLSHGVPNRISTKFQTASMAKMFTAVAIMQLVEAGKLKLEDTVGEFLPDYPSEIVKSKVTIHQLLTHKSGLSDYFNEKYDNHPKNTIRELTDFLPFFENEPLNFVPGENAQYSNSGYLLLGLIIEKITSRSYYDHIKQSIFVPAGMKHTGWRNDQVVDELARTYQFSMDQMAWIETGLGGEIGSSAGGAYSTAHDFLAFANALTTHKIIAKETLQLMSTDQNGRGYGYGLSLYKMDEETSFGHSGGASGVSANLDVFVDSGYVVVTLSNQAAMNGWYEMRSFIRRELGGRTAHTDRFFNTQKVLQVFEKEGLDAARRQLDLFENKVSVHLMLHESNQYRKQQSNQAALKILQMVVKIAPDDESVHLAMGDVYRDLGRYKEAIKSYDISLKLYPNDEATIQKRKLTKRMIDEK